ncbi:hypothetical protein TNCV_5129721 [Trichonephila clavipes]|nr:hypothetical protein TNCV_5129721 [Trichonephila clavipes]
MELPVQPPDLHLIDLNDFGRHVSDLLLIHGCYISCDKCNPVFGLHIISTSDHLIDSIENQSFRSNAVKEGEHPGECQRPPASSPSTNLTRGFATRWLFRVLPCRAGTIHLQTSMSSGFKPSPYGTAASVANHYTGWATRFNFKSKKGMKERERDFG